MRGGRRRDRGWGSGRAMAGLCTAEECKECDITLFIASKVIIIIIIASIMKGTKMHNPRA